MKSRCEWLSLPPWFPTRRTSASIFALLPVPHPQVSALLADPAGDLLANWGHWGAGGEPVSWGAPQGWASLLQWASEVCT